MKMEQTETDGEVETLIELLKIQADYHDVALPCTSEDVQWIRQLHKHVERCVAYFQPDPARQSEERSILCASAVRHLTSLHSLPSRKGTAPFKSLLPTHIPIVSVAKVSNAAKENGGICSNLVQAWENCFSTPVHCADSQYLEAFPGFMIGKLQSMEGRHTSNSTVFLDGSETASVSFLEPPRELSGSWMMVTSYNCISDVTTDVCALEVHGATLLSKSTGPERDTSGSSRRIVAQTVFGSLRHITSMMQVNRTKGQRFFVAEVEGKIVQGRKSQAQSHIQVQASQGNRHRFKVMFMERLDLHPFLLHLLDKDAEVRINGLALSKLLNLGGMEVFRSTKATHVIVENVGLHRKSSPLVLSSLSPQVSGENHLPSLLDFIYKDDHHIEDLSEEFCSIVGTVTGYQKSLAFLEIDGAAVILLTHFPGMCMPGVRKGCKLRCHFVHPLHQVCEGGTTVLVFAAGPRTSFTVIEFSPFKSLPFDMLMQSSTYRQIRQLCERHTFAAALWLVKLFDWFERNNCLSDPADWTIDGYESCHENLLVSLLEAYRVHCDQAATFLHLARAGKDDFLEEVLLGKIYHLLEDKGGCDLPHLVGIETFVADIATVFHSENNTNGMLFVNRDELQTSTECKVQHGNASLQRCTSKGIRSAIFGALRCCHGKYYLEGVGDNPSISSASMLPIRFKEGDGHIHRFHLDHVYALFDYDVVASFSSLPLDIREDNYHVLASLGNLKCVMWDKAALHSAQEAIGNLQHLVVARVVGKSINATQMEEGVKVCLSAEMLPVHFTSTGCGPHAQGQLKLEYYPGASPLVANVSIQRVGENIKPVRFEFLEQQLPWHTTICVGYLYLFHKHGVQKPPCSRKASSTFLHPLQVSVNGQSEQAYSQMTLASLSSPSMNFYLKLMEKSTDRDETASVRDVLCLKKLGSTKATDKHQFQSKKTGYRDMVTFRGVVLCKPNFRKSQTDHGFEPVYSPIEIRSLHGWDTITFYIHTNHAKIAEGIEAGYEVTVYEAERSLGAGLSLYCRSTSATRIVLDKRVSAHIDKPTLCLQHSHSFVEKTSLLQQAGLWQAFQALPLVPDRQSLDLRSYWTLCRVSSIRVLEFSWSCNPSCQNVEREENEVSLSVRKKRHRNFQAGEDSPPSLQVNLFRAFLEDGTSLVDCYLDQPEAFAILGISPPHQGAKGSKRWRHFASLAQKYGQVYVTKQGFVEASGGSSTWEAYGESRDSLLRVPLAVEDLLVLEECLELIQAQAPVLIYYRQKFRKNNRSTAGKYPWQPAASHLQEGYQHGIPKVKLLAVQQFSPQAAARDLEVAAKMDPRET
mmetsp:Transcript_10420/g.63666  ORF Transcript_10420/g.63666 Transcript_10420/m.63666 type:complete len:1315 (-) Transcript_10420:4365-8309(-)